MSRGRGKNEEGKKRKKDGGQSVSHDPKKVRRGRKRKKAGLATVGARTKRSSSVGRVLLSQVPLRALK